MEKLICWLILTSIEGVGERTVKKLYERFGSCERILTASYEELVRIVGNKKAKAIVRREGVKEPEEIVELIDKRGIGFLTLESEDYPSFLRSIPDPPPVLFFEGELKNVPLVGIVGSRRPTAYTLSLVDGIVESALSKGYGIVSGGARGVDSQAHLSAIGRSGYTACVLGFGILRAHGRPFDDIRASGGLLISEFHPLERGSSHTFPKRNRIIAALSDFLIVPEAGARSGALITADFARKYGKKVYTHIGIGRSPSWEGCYRLVKDGAELIRDGRDIFGESSPEDPLLSYLREPRTLNDVVEFLGVDEGKALSLLTELEMEGKVKRIGSFYCS